MFKPKQAGGCSATWQSSLLVPLLEMVRNVHMNFQQGQNKRVWGSWQPGDGAGSVRVCSPFLIPLAVRCWHGGLLREEKRKFLLFHRIYLGLGDLYFPLPNSFPVTFQALLRRNIFKCTFPIRISGVGDPEVHEIPFYCIG